MSGAMSCTMRSKMNQFEHVQVAGLGPCIERGLGPRSCTGRDPENIRLTFLNVALDFICRVFSSLRMEDQGPRLTLNVGGRRFDITSATLSNVPDGAGKLANLKRLLQTEENCSGEYYFDRDPEAFETIIQLLQIWISSRTIGSYFSFLSRNEHFKGINRKHPTFVFSSVDTIILPFNSYTIYLCWNAFSTPEQIHNLQNNKNEFLYIVSYLGPCSQLL